MMPCANEVGGRKKPEQTRPKLTTKQKLVSSQKG